MSEKRKFFVLVAILAIALSFIGLTPSYAATSVFVNEFHYDNDGTDAGEAIEIAGPAGTDLAGWSLVLYNGSGGAAYNTATLSGIFTDQQNGFGTIVVNYPVNGIQNGGPDGIALVDDTGSVVQFLSYEGSFVATDGPANGLTSTDIGVSEPGTTPVGQSLQLTGTGTMDEDFTWASAAANTFGAVNNGQTFGTGGDTTPPLITSFTPADDAVDVAIDANLIVELNESVQAGSGNIVLFLSSDDSVVETFDAATSGQVSYAGSTVTIDPTNDLTESTGYYVTIDNGAIEDLAGNPYQGFSGTDVWNFTTADPAPPTGSDLILTGVVDGPLSGGIPKAIEIYVANDVADLSIYGIGSANNGGGTDGEEFTFPAVAATAGNFIYIASESTGFTSFFGFAPDYTTGAAAINGDDAIELFQNGAVADVFGDINVDGTGQPWDHVDGWAYRVGGTGPDGNTFVLANWTFSGIDALDGETTNASAVNPFPIGTYAPPAPPLVLSGVVDGPLSGGVPKAIELYVGQNIADLSVYGIGSANNGGGTDGEEFTFPAVAATAGDYIYVASESAGFTSFFGFAPDYTDSAASINGDDAIELFENGAVIDVFGDINVDGTGQPWDHVDGWAYRVDGTGPDGDTFVLANWTFSGIDALDGETTNATAAIPFPIGTYAPPGGKIDEAPSVVSTFPMDGYANASLTTNIDITFSEDVTVSGAWFDLNCTTSGAVTAVATGGPTTFTLDPDVDLVNGETCTVDVFATQVSDDDTEDPPDNMAADASFSFTTTTQVCGGPITPIFDIQGNGMASLLDGTLVATEGTVTATFFDTNQMGGFVIQDAAGDGDAATSDGIYVFTTRYTPSIGDKVRVNGFVDEYFDLTEITGVQIYLNCGVGEFVTPTEVLLPVASIDDFEAYEGMLVTFPQQLTVTNNYTLGRYGELELSVNGRLFQPTNVVAPGADALALQDLNNRSRIQLDDGSGVQNPVPLPPYFNADGTLRLGDTTDNLTAVMSYGFGAYELQPVGPVVFNGTNPRTDAPDVGGSVQVASFNVLNYFTTLDGNGPICGPLANQDCRGADTADEFTRQHDKIVDAIVAMDADVVGLIEIENHATDDALQFLVDGLNAVVGAGTYDFIPTGPIGDDAIKVAFIYQPANVYPVNNYAILDSSVDPLFLDGFNRPALAQTFAEYGTGGTFTAVINHLKSKGSDCLDVNDPDTGDGQGNCNITRTNAATALANWLATDPTGSGDADFLIIGDLNAYAMEDPIMALTGAGFTNLVDAFNGEYSYQFQGQSGYLDHALSNAALTPQVTGVTPWHINGDEPAALDYNNFNQLELYKADPYRASDHDPVMIGLDLAPATNADGCYVLAISGSPFNGPATTVESYRRTFNGLVWLFHEGLDRNACLEIHGTDHSEIILGGRGNDQIFGYGGRDILFGYLGDDQFTGGSGRDRFFGSAGYDTVLDREIGERCFSIEEGCY